MVGAFSAAEDEIGFALDFVDFPSHQMQEIFAHLLHPAAVPFGDRVLVEEGEIFVPPVQKGDGIGELFQLGPQAAFLLAVIPEKAEIPANRQNIPRLQPLGRRGGKSGKIAVDIAGYVYHAAFMPFLPGA